MSAEKLAVLYELVILAGLIVAVAVVIVLIVFCPRDHRRRERQWREHVEGARQSRVRQNAQREAAIGPNQYRCTACSKVYNKGRDDAEAMAEALEVFGGVLNANGPPCIVCADCYKLLMGDDPPRLDESGRGNV